MTAPGPTITLDTRSLTPEIMDPEACKHSLAYELQPILDKEFSDCYPKRKILIKRDSLNFACPFCHDSMTSMSKKRAHFILTGEYAGTFKCFNCGKYMKIPSFFRYFHSDISLKTLASVNKIAQDSSSNKTGNAKRLSVTAEVINKDEARIYAINREKLKALLLLQEITPTHTPDAWNYLTNRCQTNMSLFLYSAQYQQIFILNLVDNDNILGIQLRDISGKSAVKYKTLTCSKIHKLILRDTVQVPENIDTLSTAFGVFNLNLYNPVIVTEGPFDSFLLPNCMATAGANKDLGIQIPFWFLYDSDDTGNKHAMQMLKSGYQVFMWKKFRNDYGLPPKKKWDITDVFMYCRDHNIQFRPSDIMKYFTSSMLQGLNI